MRDAERLSNKARTDTGPGGGGGGPGGGRAGAGRAGDGGRVVREPDQVGTEGALLVAPAGGTVNQSFLHANAGNVIQINHGGGWFTTYIHLQTRSVSAGQQVAQGQPIGRVGRTGETANNQPHLHFEQAIDSNGNGSASWGTAGSERVRPVFNGFEYAQAVQDGTSSWLNGRTIGSGWLGT